MSSMSQAQVSDSAPYQCPTCGEPIGGTMVSVIDLCVLLEGCGHKITFAEIRESWGLDVPAPIRMSH